MKRLELKPLIKHVDEINDLTNLDGCQYYSNSPEMFFQDGKRRIDYVLAYKEKNPQSAERRNLFYKMLVDQSIEIEVEDCMGNILAATGDANYSFPDKKFTSVSTNHNIKTNMELNLMASNVESCEDVIFVKLHASWYTLCRVAEILQIKKPIKQGKGDRLSEEQSTGVCKCLQLNEKDVPELPLPYTATFSRSRLFLFEIPPDKSTFFTPTERSHIVYYVIQRASQLSKSSVSKMIDCLLNRNSNVVNSRQLEDSKKNEKEDIELESLLADSTFLAGYPLHEPSADLIKLIALKDENPDQSQIGTVQVHENNMRIMLSEQWSSLKKVTKQQPLDYVRLYFGEAVAMYFAWLGLYTTWLIPVAIFGLAAFLFGTISLNTNEQIRDVCARGSQFIMCPPCNADACKFWTLNQSCFSQKLTHLVDNEGTVLYAIFMALWATIFMEHWKRYQNVLAIRWNVQNYEPVDEPARPEYMALLNKGYPFEKNEITGLNEPEINFWTKRLPINIVTYASIIFGIILALAFLLGVICYRLVINEMLLQHENHIVVSTAGIITTITSSIINLICIFILKLIYDKVAVIMTNLQNHRTQSEYDQSLTLKLYLLHFVNFYSSIFYIAFIQGTTAALPGDRSVPIRSMGCDSGNCLFQLFIQLAIIMVGKQLLNFVTENTLPPLKRLFKTLLAKRLRKEKSNEDDQLEITGSKKKYGATENVQACQNTQNRPRLYNCRLNYTLLDAGSRPLFDEYLEMMIQFGFITMFVPAFPIAPVFAFLNNIFEIRADAGKFLTTIRRPIAKPAKSIGIWFSILSVVSSIAIRTNACLIAFTTGFINRLTYQYYYSKDQTLNGFVNFSLSIMNASRFDILPEDSLLLNQSNTCRYPDFRAPPDAPEPYSYTTEYWHILGMKFAFVFVFEIVAIVLTSIIANIIPDMPENLATISRHEVKVVNEIILEGEKDEDKNLFIDEPIVPPKFKMHFSDDIANESPFDV